VAALGFAQQQLDTHGEFYPYAVVIDDHGQQRMVAADIGSDRPESGDLITALIAALSNERDHLRAAAIVADVRLPETGSDAIRVTSGTLRTRRPHSPTALQDPTLRPHHRLRQPSVRNSSRLHLAELSYFRRRFSRAIAAWPSTGSSRNDSNTS
jgi:hypothetical protein